MHWEQILFYIWTVNWFATVTLNGFINSSPFSMGRTSGTVTVKIVNCLKLFCLWKGLVELLLWKLWTALSFFAFGKDWWNCYCENCELPSAFLPLGRTSGTVTVKIVNCLQLFCLWEGLVELLLWKLRTDFCLFLPLGRTSGTVTVILSKLKLFLL